ncbi:MAG: ABC transporter substrate-binding protein [Chthoniobacteraceae bacterium]
MKNTFRLLFSVVVLFVFCGTSAFGADQPQNLDTVHLQLRWKHQFQFAGYYAAVEQGYYRDAGLDVIIDEATDTREPIGEVTQGRAEFGIGTSELIVARSQGKPVVVLGAIFQHSPFIFLVRKESGITNVHGLSGKKVAIEPGATELLAYLKYEGLDLNKIDTRPHPYDTAPLINGELDAMSAYSTDEPFKLKAAGVDYLMFDPRAGGIDFYGDTLFTSEEQIKSHPARVRAFLDASLKGWKYALAHPEEMVDLIYTKYSQRHSREHLMFETAASRKLIMPDIIEIGYINAGRWKFIADTYVELGLMPPGYSLDGFLYDRNPRTRLQRYYAAIAGLAGLLLVVGAIGFRFYALNRKLKWEMGEREKVARELRIAEERYRLLVEQAPFPIAISNFDGKILFVNPRWVEIFKFDRQSAIGLNAAECYADPDRRGGMLQLLELRGTVNDYEVLMLRAGGETFWAYLSASKILFEGRPAIFTTFNDITVRIKTEAERDRLIEELQAAAMEIETLSGILPICAGCKQIRDDQGFWNQVEHYIETHSKVRFSHGFCPDCVPKYFPELAEAPTQPPTA